MTDSTVLGVPVSYAPGLPVGDRCMVCGAGAPERLVNDHCHKHGWLRGTVCQACNMQMRSVDEGFIAINALLRLGSLTPLLDHHARCVDCTPPTLQQREKYASANLTSDAAIALRTLVATMTIAKGRRVTASELVAALVELGNEQQDELLTRLQKGE